MPESGNVIYTNKNELRGQFLLLHNGVTQPKISAIWRKVLEEFQPTIALDAGVNYGGDFILENTMKYEYKRYKLVLEHCLVWEYKQNSPAQFFDEGG